jgi:MoaA/NifB/PqqE/SkfB family radical SAM enzyme
LKRSPLHPRQGRTGGVIRQPNIFVGLHPASGVHPEEEDLWGPFTWMMRTLHVVLFEPASHLFLRACYHGHGGHLVVQPHGVPEFVLELHFGWIDYVIDLGVAVSGSIDLTVDPLIPAEGDSRELGMMFRRLEAFDDSERFRALSERAENAALNRKETDGGVVQLRSMPPKLRITMEQKCNVIPRCVYCEWDWAKEKEEHASLGLLRGDNGSLGRPYALSTEIVDCSYGEPFLRPDIGTFLEKLAQDGKRLEMTTNAQILGEKQRKLILGKDIFLYVSLDAADRDLYRHYRNDAFDRLVDNVRALCNERESYGRLPRVILSFILMRSNVGEIPKFLDLAQELGVDAVKLRGLYVEGFGLPESVVRAGREFRYREEVLEDGELRRAVDSARAGAKARGLFLFADTEDFQKHNGQARRPICTEPWETMYVLSRGIMPCCFGKRPLVELQPEERADVGSALEEIFNGPEYRELRQTLARGDLPSYCKESPSCPIVRKRNIIEANSQPQSLDLP